MAKILLVEDDNNLREIYEARLQAEGYTIVSAHDGEEALVVAKAEKPDLIISDVMMPKISGFEMLDILRNTDSLKNVKVIMLTALGQSDDQQRADKLGTDRYLVKSQVTLEDIVNVANELLQKGEKPADVSMPTGPSSTSTPSEPPDTTPPAAPSEPAQPPSSTPPPPAAPIDTTPPASSAPDTASSDITLPTAPASTDEPAIATSTSIPVSSDAATTTPTVDSSLAESASEEESQVKSQINEFIDKQESSQPSEEPATPAVEVSPTMPSTTVTPDDAPSTSAYKIPGQAEEATLHTADQQVNSSAVGGYTPQPSGKKVIEPLPDADNKPTINELLEKEKAKEIVESKTSEDAPPTMSAADTSPAPSVPVITPSNEPATPAQPQQSVDPNSIAL